MMDLAGLNCLDSTFLNHEGQHQLLLFDERRKCLNAVFWTVFNALEEGRRTMLVVERDEELEYLNYFLSKYKLTSLSLILNQENDFVSWHAVQKLSNHNRAPHDTSELDMTERQLQALDKEICLIHDKLRKPQLGQLSLMDAYNVLKAYRGPLLRLELYRMVPQKSYREMKSLVLKAEQLYKPEFRFKARYNIFRPAIFHEHTPESLLVVLKHLREMTRDLLERVENKQSGIYEIIESDYTDRFNAVKQQVRRIGMLLESESSPTNMHKIKYHIEQTVVLSGIAMNCDEPEQGDIRNYIESVEAWLVDERTHINRAYAKALARLNGHNSQLDLASLFADIDSCLEEIRTADILSGLRPVYCNSLETYRDSLRKRELLLAQAIAFLNDSSGELEWCVFYEKQKNTERRILDSLIEVESDWISCFEASYIKSFLQVEAAQLDSIADSHVAYAELIAKLEETVHNRILEIHESSEDPEVAHHAKQGMLWSVFARDYSDELFRQFPLVVMKPDFYHEHGARMLSGIDELVTVNFVPESIPNTEGLRLNITGYNARMKTAVDKLSDLSRLEVVRLEGVAFNINRSAHFLKGTELNKLSLYLAEGIRYFNPDYRIFQLKDKAILSLLTKEKNASLFLKLEGRGIKEILSHDENQNLIPAILNENIGSTVVLIEDMMLDPLNSENIAKQKVFLEEMQVAGLQILSIDNCKLLKNQADELGVLVRKILEHSESPAVRV